jgi:hypothetical protein
VSVAYGAPAIASPADASFGGGPQSAVQYATGVPLFSDYEQQCASNRVYSSSMMYAPPFYQVDLGRNIHVTDVQLWTAASFQTWLSPVQVYLTNVSGVSPASNAFSAGGVSPCWTTPADGAAVASLQTPPPHRACAAWGRYVTLTLAPAVDGSCHNTANPGNCTLRLCALLVFAAPPPPPPRPPPAPPKPRPAPPALPAPTPSLPWYIILSIVGGMLLGLAALWYTLAPRRRHTLFRGPSHESLPPAQPWKRGVTDGTWLPASHDAAELQARRDQLQREIEMLSLVSPTEPQQAAPPQQPAQVETYVDNSPYPTTYRTHWQ